ncbi:hypothetical protein B0I35DRAFT_122860 [Stachybotrys elegans]|uniref:Uncharacterized protein n=1 Tax=Stachybotrys elegans TaxID=80388 RepID=A0A8K0WUT8_9HYPO|nr:hypothetical protein B0I35DRAFT_122860 [Stachybotrys elegans]
MGKSIGGHSVQNSNTRPLPRLATLCSLVHHRHWRVSTPIGPTGRPSLGPTIGYVASGPETRNVTQAGQWTGTCEERVTITVSNPPSGRCTDPEYPPSPHPLIALCYITRLPDVTLERTKTGTTPMSTPCLAAAVIAHILSRSPAEFDMQPRVVPTYELQPIPGLGTVALHLAEYSICTACECEDAGARPVFCMRVLSLSLSRPRLQVL